MPAVRRNAWVLLAASLVAAPALAQEEAADSAVADTAAAADTTAAADTAAVADTTAAADTAAVADDSLAAAADTAEGGPQVPHVVPSLEGLTLVGISYQDMVAGTPGDETRVEIWRGAAGQVLRFATGTVAWAYVVRPLGGTDAYTLRDFDCSGAFGEELQAGTPLAVPDCAVSARGAAAPADGD